MKHLLSLTMLFLFVSTALKACSQIVAKPLQNRFSTVATVVPASFQCRANIVDASSMRDIRDASAFETYALPKIYIKQYYCVEAAVHQRIVRSRSRTDRRNRDPPPRFRR